MKQSSLHWCKQQSGLPLKSFSQKLVNALKVQFARFNSPLPSYLLTTHTPTRTHGHTHTQTQTHKCTHTLTCFKCQSPSLPLNTFQARHSCPHTLSQSHSCDSNARILSLSHSHCLSCTHTLNSFHSFKHTPSLTHMYTHTHTSSHTRTHAHT